MTAFDPSLAYRPISDTRAPPVIVYYADVDL